MGRLTGQDCKESRHFPLLRQVREQDPTSPRGATCPTVSSMAAREEVKQPQDARPPGSREVGTVRQGHAAPVHSPQLRATRRVAAAARARLAGRPFRAALDPIKLVYHLGPRCTVARAIRIVASSNRRVGRGGAVGQAIRLAVLAARASVAVLLVMEARYASDARVGNANREAALGKRST